jgi:hypothetical protein
MKTEEVRKAETRWELKRQFRDRFWEREQQLITQRCLRERLRYKKYQRAGTLGRFMQKLGNIGRALFPYIGRGWNGIGPR